MGAPRREMRCLACGYEIGSIRGAPACPECGRPIDAAHRRAARRGAAIGRRLDAIVLRHLAAWGVVVLVYALGAGVVTRSPTNAVVTLTMLAVGVLGTIVMGFLAAKLARPWERAPIRAAWLAALPWLHGPWLMIAPATIIILAIGLVDRWSYNDGVLTGTAGLVGILLWLLGCVGCFAGAADAWGTRMRRVSLPGLPTLRGRMLLVEPALFFITLAGCMLVGLLGGIAAVDAALELVTPIWGEF